MTDDDGPTTLDPGFYVIARPRTDRAKVITGPCTRQVAEHRKTIFTHQGWVMASPYLVHAIEDQGFEVEWGEAVRKPAPLREE